MTERARQLKAMQVLSGTFMGFSFTVLTNLLIAPDLSPVLIAFVSLGAGAVICCMLVSLLSAMYALVALFRFEYDDHDKPSTAFEFFWKQNCKSEWRMSIRAFSLGAVAWNTSSFCLSSELFIGMVFFLLTLGVATGIHASEFIQSHELQVTSSAIAAVACLFSCLYILSSLWHKWGAFLFSDQGNEDQGYDVG